MDSRPKNLDLLKINLPVPGLVSILHRISGFGLFVLLPFLLWLLQSSLASPDSYLRYRAAIAHPAVKLILIGLVWAFLHHFFAGLRFLMLDVHVGTELATARHSSWAVLAVSILLTLGLGALIW